MNSNSIVYHPIKAIPPVALHWWQFMLIIGCVVVGIILILLVLNKISKGRFSFFGVKSMKDNKCDISDISDCPNKLQYFFSFRKIWTFMYQIDYIKTTKTVKIQMDKAYEFIVKIKQDFFVGNFLSLLRKNLDNINNNISVTEHPDYIYYELLLYHFEDFLKDLFRAAFKNNGLTDPKLNFDEYTKNKINFIISETTSWFNQRYANGKIVSREELFKKETEKIDDFKQLISQILSTAKNVSFEQELETKKYREGIRLICENVGIPHDIIGNLDEDYNKADRL